VFSRRFSQRGARCPSGVLVMLRRLVENVEEALFDTGCVGVVLVEEGLVDEMLAEPLKGVFRPFLGEVSGIVGGERWGGAVAHSTSHTSLSAFLIYGASL
jgi:hypothetical protein